MNSFEGFLSKSADEGKEIIILGDFHCDYTNTSNNSTNTLKFITDLYDFQQLINEPTRSTTMTSSTIDLIFTNLPERISKSGVIHCGISDHNLIFCICKINHKLKSGHKEIFYRDIKSFDLKTFKDCINKAKWEDLFVTIQMLPGKCGMTPFLAHLINLPQSGKNVSELNLYLG